MRTPRLATVLPLFALCGPAVAAEFEIRSQALEDRKAVFATVETVDVAQARARIGGTLAVLSVDEGDAVAAGQRIAVVADPKLQLELAAIDERIRALQAQRDLAATELNRSRELLRSGTIPKARVDDAETALTVAERALSAMKAERQVVAERHAEGAVLAPAAGRVLQVLATEGMVIQPGEPIAKVAAENYILRLELPERHARFMKTGDVVQVGERGLSASPESLRDGRIRQVYPQIRQGRVVADATVDGLGDYYVGERVRVFVATGTREGFVLPREFLYSRYGVDYVRLKSGDEVVVQPGEAVAGGVEILSGVRAGDVVVTP